MPESKRQVEITETKQALFNFLKAQAPALFGTRVFADVEYLGQLETDTSYIVIRFNKEAI